MTKIKICGLRRVEDISYVNEYRPDYIGFVFAKSRRQITKAQARKLRSLLNKDIIPVGVFVNEKSEVVAELVREGIIDMVQLHGEEDEAYISRLRELVPKVKIIKAIRVAGKEDIIKGNELAVDYLLFDAFSVKEQGGTGERFDWNLLASVENMVDKPFFLAGGINSENVSEALKMCDAFGVDVSSSVETDGYKDKEKIERFIKAIRQTQ